jgi:S1-C subfamily serine protease
MSCKEIQTRLRQAEVPSEAAKDHIRSCGECSRVSEAEAALTGLLRSVEHVPAPMGFERSVMSEIGVRRSAGRANIRVLRPALLVPAAALLVVAAIFLGLYGPGLLNARSSNIAAGPAVPSSTPAAVPDTTERSGTESPVPESQVAGVSPDEKSPAARESEPKLKQVPGDRVGRKTSADATPGSRDLATRAADPVRPQGVGPVRDPSNSDGGPVQRSFSPGEVFEMFGVEAEYGGNGWRVISVRPGGIGANAGLRPGDILKTLDGRELTEEPLSGTSVGGERIVVIRGGREITLSLKPGN